jgi:hypothetical protein
MTLYKIIYIENSLPHYCPKKKEEEEKKSIPSYNNSHEMKSYSKLNQGR